MKISRNPKGLRGAKFEHLTAEALRMELDVSRMRQEAIHKAKKLASTI